LTRKQKRCLTAARVSGICRVNGKMTVREKKGVMVYLEKGKGEEKL